MVNSSNLLALVHEAASETTPHIRLEELACMNAELARVVAANICTAPEVLVSLSTSKDYETRKAVASNPNTPTETLFQLGVEFPQQLLDNPVFSLLLLENPNLYQELPEDTQASLLKLEVIPDTFLQWALSYRRPKTMFAVAMNPKLTKNDLYKLICEAGSNWLTSQVPNVAKLHINWMGEMKAGWEEAALSVVQKHQLVKDNIQHDNASEYKLWQIGVIPEAFLTALHRNTLIQIARDPDTPAHILEALLKPKTASKKVRAAIANNLNTPVHLLEQLAGDDNALVRQIAFQNPNTPKNIYKLFYEYDAAIQNPSTTGATLREIAKRDWDYTRTGVASHPNTPPEILAKLAYNKSWKIRAAVAGNKSVPIEVLEVLMEDKRLRVCHAVVCNPITPASLLVRMLSNYKSYHRHDIAKHPNATPAILEVLARDTDCYVRAKVVENPNTPVELLSHLAKDKDFYIRNHVAGNIRTPETVLVQLAEDSEYMVRQHVAYNPKTPVSVLRKLAVDEDNNVRCAVAENDSTPLDVLALLEQDEVEWVKARAKIFRQTKSLNPLHPNLSTCEDNTLTATNPDTPIEVLLELARSDSYQIYLLSIQNICRKIVTHDIPAALLERCAALDTIEIQIALAQHPNIPKSLASKFASSHSFRLRRLLAQNPNLPPELVKKLLQDKNEDVRRVALVRLIGDSTNNLNNTKVNCGAYIEFLQQWQAVQNPDVSSQVLVELAQSEWVIIREAVALHPKTAMIVFDTPWKPDSKFNESNNLDNRSKSDAPVTLLEKLAADKHVAVKLGVARNSNCPADVLEHLARNHPNILIHIAAVKSLLIYHPQRGKSYLEDFTSSNYYPSISNFFVLLNHLAPSDLLAKHCRSSSWLERYAVATNPNTPPEIRQLLAEDANRIVKAAAKAFLSAQEKVLSAE